MKVCHKCGGTRFLKQRRGYSHGNRTRPRTALACADCAAATQKALRRERRLEKLREGDQQTRYSCRHLRPQVSDAYIRRLLGKEIDWPQEIVDLKRSALQARRVLLKL